MAQPPSTPPVVPRATELAPQRVVPDSTAIVPQRKEPTRELGKPDDDLRLDVVSYRVDDDAPPAVRAACR